MKGIFAAIVLIISLNAWGQGVVVNPDGTHSVIHATGNGNGVAVNANGTHTVIHATGNGNAVAINPNGTHSFVHSTGNGNATIMHSNGTSSFVFGTAGGRNATITNPDGTISFFWGNGQRQAWDDTEDLMEPDAYGSTVIDNPHGPDSISFLDAYGNRVYIEAYKADSPQLKRRLKRQRRP